MNYNLTDYSASELFTISGVIKKEIDETVSWISEVDKMDDSQMKSILKKEKNEKLSVLREHHVHLLTALDIVRSREQVLSN